MIFGAGRRVRVFASTRPIDLRKSFDTLSQVVMGELGGDPLSGDVYLFVNARCTRAKALLWDGTGLCIYAKRLERGHFAAPWKRSTDGMITMSMSELALFFEGSKLVFVGALSPEEVEPARVATKSLTVR
jgi:transposase